MLSGFDFPPRQGLPAIVPGVLDGPGERLAQQLATAAISALTQVISSHSGMSGGHFTTSVEELLRDYHGAADVLLTTSCTSALELAALLIKEEQPETVVVPSYGFVTTALAFVRAGFRIRFVDIDEETLGIDPDSLSSAMDPSVRAVVPIHYGGSPVDISAIGEIVKNADRCTLIEDNAHSLFASIDGRPLGTFGSMSTLSFHGTKNFSCGEGGALVVNDEPLVSRARVMYEKGTDRTLFLQGEVDKYQWRDLGSSFALSEYLAAILWSQLQHRDAIQAHRSEIDAIYRSILEPAADPTLFRLSKPQDRVQSARHLFWILMADPDDRDSMLRALKRLDVRASSHYIALHETPGGQRWADSSPPCPTASSVARRLLRLPLDHTVTPSEAERNAHGFLQALRLLAA